MKDNLPIDKEILIKRMAIPQLIAKLSYIDESAAIKYIRIWGERKMPVTVLFEELSQLILE